MKVEVSYHQERLWFIDQFESNNLYDSSPVYHNIPLILEIAGSLDIKILERGIQAVINRHEALRTQILTIDNRPFQFINQNTDFKLVVLDQDDNGETRDIDNAMALALEEVKRPFLLDRESLVRGKLIQMEKAKFLLVIVGHHIIADKFSLEILADEILLYYEAFLNNRLPQLPDLNIHYADFSQWQRGFSGEVLESLLLFWKMKLYGKIQPLEIPVDRPRALIHIYQDGRQSFSLPAKLSKKIKAFSEKGGVNHFTILLSAFKSLLYRYSGQDEIIVGTSLKNRNEPGIERIIGPIANLVALRSFFSGSSTFSGILNDLDRAIRDVLKYQALPFDKLVLELKPDKDMSRTALFDVLFQYEENPLQIMTLQNLNIRIIETNLGWGKYDLNVLLQRKGETISGIVVYNTEYYDDWRISHLIDHYMMLLEIVLEDINRELSKICLLTDEERKQILVDFNQTEAGYPKDKTIHRLFEEQAERTPDQIAIVGPSIEGNISQKICRLTYRELNERSERVASWSRERGVEADTIVGIIMKRSIEMIIGIIGILKSGGAYLPIDPDYPQERIDFMLEDSGAKILLKKSEMDNAPGETFQHSVSSIHHSSHLAYVIYTSGTTGKPKGVLVEHRNVVRLLFNDKFPFDFSQDDTWILFHSFCFDFSVWEMYGALLYGGRLIVISRMTARDTSGFLGLLRAEAVTVLNQTPSAFYRLMDEELQQETKSLRIKYVIFGGEALSPGKLKKWRDRYPDIRLVNMFGITETTVHVTYKEITTEQIDLNFSNIGKPIPTLSAYVMDENRKLSPIGLNNELYIGGAGIARGYLNRPELTTERFIKNPYKKGEILYRSGDLVRFLVNGDILYSGRIDHQVQLRGFRIELGEIENRLLKCSGVREAVVVDNEDEAGDKYLCAYIITDETLEVTSLRNKLIKVLPDYMIPSYFVKIDRIPLTPNGKVDRKALPKPLFKEMARDCTVPLNEVQQKLQEIWSGVLNIEKKNIGINTSFFEIGGHSLKATILISQIHKALNIKIPLAQIFTNPTIKELSEYIGEAKEDRFMSIEPVKEKEYYQLSSAQRRFYVLQQIENNSTAYNMSQGFPLPKDIDKEKLVSVFNRLIARHETLRTSFEVEDGEPVQKVHKNIELNLQLYKTDEAGLGSVMQNFTRPFDLGAPSLLRVGLVEIESPSPYYYLLVEMHHIISDEVSQNLLQKEFMELYSDREPPSLKLQYKDFSEWENSSVQQAAIKKQEAYWLKQFDGELPVLNLPLDFPRPTVQSNEGCIVRFHLPRKDSDALKTIARQEGATMFMVLLTVYNLFLAKLCSQEDIVVGAPVAGRKHSDLEKIIGVFINSLALRNFPGGEKTVREFLNQVKTNTLEAFENQEYPFEDLVKKVMMMERVAGHNPIFDVMLNLLNREDYVDTIPEDSDDGGGLYTHVKSKVRFDMNLVAVDFGERVFCIFFYCTALFKSETIERFIGYFKKIISQLPGILDRRTAEIDILSEAEKQQLLLAFNDFAADYPCEKTIIQLFEEQVVKTPDSLALVFEDYGITYRQLNEQANRLGGLLRDKGVRPDTLVGLMVRRSVEMIVGIWGILKSGGAYLPVNPEAPEDRITYMLDNASVTILLTQEKFIEKFAGRYQVINLNSPNSYKDSGADPECKNAPTDLAYVIYTSGSTGKPKGVMIQNRSVINIVKWFAAQYNLKPGFQLLQMFEYTFDASINQIFGSLLHGVTLHVIRKEYFFDIEFLREYIISHFINLINFVQSVIKEVLCGREKIESLKYVISGAEKLKSAIKNEILDNGYALYNQYGPTEVTVDALAEKCSYESNGTVGVPVYNAQCYIVNKYGRLNPVGVAGELWVSGDGLARGYINSAELTVEKLIPNPFIPGSKVYRTGDLTRWLPAGNVEFLGRIDTQVKIRGFRIEPVEIANQLLKINGIKEAVVIDREDTSGEIYLCAYLVGEEKTEKRESGEIKDTLSRSLPDYMIPSYYVWIDRLPLSGHGKLIRSALPEPDMANAGSYVPPSNYLEIKLVEIWSEVLNIDKRIIGINSDFFELGGHSLKATILVSKIHKELNVKLPLAEVFRAPTVKDMSETLKTLKETKYSSLIPVEKKEYYELSSAQKRLYVLQQFDLESVVYNMPYVFPLGLGIEKEKLENTFKKIISRHESLKTSFEIVNGEPVQSINENVDFSICSFNASEAEAEHIISNFAKPFDLSKAPLLRVGLLTINSTRQVLLIDMHHIITDGVSQSILEKEFMALYSGEDLPPLRLQYKDYSAWQNNQRQRLLIEEQKRYWLEMFAEEIPVLNLPTDYHRPVLQSFEGARVRFLLTVKESQVLKELVKQTGATLYMCILSIFTILLSRLSGQEDIIVGTPIAARRHVDLEKIIGMFVNTLALRNAPRGEKKYRAFLQELKECTLNAYENQEYTFEELVDKISVSRDTGRNPIFDVMFNFLNIQENNYNIPESKTGDKHLYSHRKGISKFDLTLIAEDLGERLLFNFEYCTRLFKPETIDRFISYFKRLLDSLANDFDKKIWELDIITEEEKHRILYEFNDKDVDYPKDKTIHQMFEEQVERTPGNIALVGSSLLPVENRFATIENANTANMFIQISYNNLNEQANRLAYMLQKNGVGPDTLVGIMVGPSVEMIVGLLGILKAGGAYLPIESGYPIDRIDYMLKDSAAKILVTTGNLAKEVVKLRSWKGKNILIEEISKSPESSLRPLTFLPGCLKNSSNIAYLIYTSGSTGRPKGVIIEHRQVINTLFYRKNQYRLNADVTALQLFSYSFDGFVTSFFTPLISGAKVILAGNQWAKDIDRIKTTIIDHQVSQFISVPALYHALIDEMTEAEAKSLQVVILAGDKLSEEILAKTRQKNRALEIAHEYGVTEASVMSTIFRHQQLEPDIKIGKPIWNTRVYILDTQKDTHLQPVGIPGELCIAGVGVARGYLNNPQLNVTKFIFNSPFTPPTQPFPLYKTGDLARWLPDGNIEFLGRIDYQVKVRGFRIELGEIENCLLKISEVKEAVVVIREEVKEDKNLAAYIVSDRKYEIAVLRDYLSKELPGYMIPSYFMQMEKLPLTSNGKIDRRALSGLNIDRSALAGAYVAPKEELEIKIASIWSELLTLEKVGMYDDFFDLGGNSIKVIQLKSRLTEELKKNIPVVDLFQYRTIRSFVEYIDKSEENEIMINNKFDRSEKFDRAKDTQKNIREKRKKRSQNV